MHETEVELDDIDLIKEFIAKDHLDEAALARLKNEFDLNEDEVPKLEGMGDEITLTTKQQKPAREINDIHSDISLNDLINEQEDLKQEDLKQDESPNDVNLSIFKEEEQEESIVDHKSETSEVENDFDAFINYCEKQTHQIPSSSSGGESASDRAAKRDIRMELRNMKKISSNGDDIILPHPDESLAVHEQILKQEKMFLANHSKKETYMNNIRKLNSMVLKVNGLFGNKLPLATIKNEIETNMKDSKFQEALFLLAKQRNKIKEINIKWELFVAIGLPYVIAVGIFLLQLLLSWFNFNIDAEMLKQFAKQFIGIFTEKDVNTEEDSTKKDATATVVKTQKGKLPPPPI